MTFVTTSDNLYIRIRDLCCPYGLKGNMTVVQEFSYLWKIEKNPTTQNSQNTPLSFCLARLTRFNDFLAMSWAAVTLKWHVEFEKKSIALHFIIIILQSTKWSVICIAVP